MTVPGTRRVLVVDDDAAIRVLLQTFLERRGFLVTTAIDGREALVEMRAGRVSLVVMDLMMPVVSGWDVLRERAAQPFLLNIPMIVITASNVGDVMLRILDQGVCEVLAKPFDLDALLSTVTSCLARAAPTPLAAA